MRVSVRERTTSGAVHERTRKTSVHRGRADDGGVRFDEALAFDVDVSDASRLSLRVELHSHRRPHALLGALHLASRVRPPAPLPPLAPTGSDQQRVGAGGGGEDSKPQQQQWFASSCEARAQWLDVLAQRVRSDAPRWHPVVSEPCAHRNNEGDSIWRRARNSLLRHKRAARGGAFDAHTQPDAGGDSGDAGPGGGEKSELEGDSRQGSRRGSRSLLWPFGSVRERRRRTTECKAQALLNKQMSFQ